MELYKILHEASEESSALEAFLFNKKMEKEFGSKEVFEEYKKVFHAIKAEVKDEVAKIQKDENVDILSESFSKLYNNKNSHAILYDVVLEFEKREAKEEFNNKQKKAIDKLLKIVEKAIKDLGYSKNYYVKTVQQNAVIKGQDLELSYGINLYRK